MYKTVYHEWWLIDHARYVEDTEDFKLQWVRKGDEA